MTETLNAVLPIFIYSLLIVLLVIGIILGIKLIITVDKVNKIMDDVSEKLSLLDNVFKLLRGVSDKVSILSSKITDIALSLVNKIGNLRKRKEDDEYE